MTLRSTRTSGFTLIEITVALAVSLIAMFAAVRLYTHAGSALRSAQAQHSLTETARLALTAIRRDAELAGYLAFGEPDRIADTLANSPVTVGNDCGPAWAVALDEPVGGDNNGYRWACPAYAHAPVFAADTLVFRYVDTRRAETLEPGRLYLDSSPGAEPRIFTALRSEVSANDTLASTNAIHARGYYVSRTSAGSTAAEPVPALRMKSLSRSSAGPRIVDAEVQPGIEDMQIEFGIDTDAAEGPRSGSVERYVSADEIDTTSRVVAIRVWLLVRSAYRERGFAGATLPAYADRAAKTYHDGYRRRLTTTTIVIDDARPL